MGSDREDRTGLGKMGQLFRNLRVPRSFAKSWGECSV